MRAIQAVFLACGIGFLALFLRDTGYVWASLVGAGLALGALYYALAGMAVVAIFIRAALALVPVGLMAAGLIYWFVQAPYLTEDEARALIAASVVAAGWVVAFVTGELRQATQEQEKRRDMIRAAISEVDLIVSFAQKQDWDGLIQQTQRNFADDPDYVTFILYGNQFTTVRRLVEQVEILGSHQIRPLMDFFQLLDRLEQMTARMAEPGFQALPTQRRLDILLRYLRMQKGVSVVGKSAAMALRDRPFHGLLRHVSP